MCCSSSLIQAFHYHTPLQIIAASTRSLARAGSQPSTDNHIPAGSEQMAASMVTSPSQLVGALGDYRRLGNKRSLCFSLANPSQREKPAAGVHWACLAGAVPSPAGWEHL